MRQILDLELFEKKGNYLQFKKGKLESAMCTAQILMLES